MSDSDVCESLMEMSRLAARLAQTCQPDIEKAALAIAAALRSGGKVLACGNGGSAADAQHLVGEFIGRFLFNRPSLPAITLSADTSVLTALANDYGFETVFARQIESLGNPGDVLVAFSTSGKSPNVLRAIEAARRRKLKTIVLAGPDSNPVLETCDVCIHIPAPSTPRIQEMHTAVLHAICQRVETEMFPGKPNQR